MRLFLPTDDVFKIVMNYSHLEIDPRIIRAFLDKSGDTIGWLEQKGVDFDSTSIMFDNYGLPVYHAPKGGHGGATIVKALVKNCNDIGVRLLFQTPVTKILKGEKGNVTGVLAAMEEKELIVTAKSVIIATGGHGGNQELLKKYHPSYTEDLYYAGIPHLMGDGLLMAGEIGANTEGPGTLLYHGPTFPGPIHLPESGEMRAVIREPFTVWVNKRGERFADESWPYSPVDTANALGRQPNKVCYSLFDEKIKQSIMEEGLRRGAGHLVKPGTKPHDFEKQIKLQEKKEWVKTSDSWDEIAGWIGAAPEVLKSTINEYNRFCDQGHDKDFLKDRRHLLPLRTPPYYATKCIQSFLDTIGGIKINHYMEVLDHYDNAIPGLYASGVTTSGWEPETYCIILSGNAFGFAINSGRIAGESAAKYVKEQKAN